IPASVGGVPAGAINDNVSFIGRVDHAPYDWKTTTPSPTTFGLTGYAKWAHAQAQGMGPTGTSAHAGETSQAIGSLEGEYSFYFGRDYLGDVRSGVTYARNTGDPYLRLPDGRALVSSTFADGTGGVSTLQFGGNGGLSTS